MKATILLLSMFATYPATYGKDTNPACVTIVRIPIPWYAPKFYVKSRNGKLRLKQKINRGRNFACRWRSPTLANALGRSL